MNLFVPILAFGGVLALMIWLLLDPSSLVNAMQSAIPPEARSSPPRYPHLPVILIFAAGVGLFYTLEAKGVIHSPHSVDALQFCLSALGAFFFGANGVWACYWPISFQRRYIPQLRNIKPDTLSDEAKHTLAISGKCWGAAMILLCSYLVHLIGVAAS